LISSFSKIVKPDIRVGFMRVSKSLMESHEMVPFFFRNLSAGVSRGMQAGLTALIESDPKLEFLKDVIAGYKQKNELVQQYLSEWGCEFPYEAAGTYMMFPSTPDGSDSEEFVRKTAVEKKTGFIPGTSFGGKYEGFEDIRKHFRMGFGAGMSAEKLEGILKELTA
jgi:aspartate/methionine/tyrosine aminotransferase